MRQPIARLLQREIARRLFACSALLASAACQSEDPSMLATATSARALVQTVDGFYFYGPLGTAPVPTTGTFDATLLERLRVVLEWSDAGGTHAVAAFDAHTSPALVLARTYEFYLVNVPAAPNLTDPTLPYRFRVLLDGAELGRADVPAQVFAVTAANPSFTVGVRFRVDRRSEPTLSAISPTLLTSGAGATLTLSGSGFASDSVARIDGLSYATRGDPGTRFVDLPAAALAVAGDHSVTLFTPNPGGGESAAATFRVQNAQPSLASLTPDSASAGSSDLVLTLLGSGFVAGATARFGATDLATSFVSAAELTAILPASLLASGAAVDVSVTNPAPTAGPSGSLRFTVALLAPTLTAISQDSTFAGTGGLTVTLTGRGFLPGAVATFAGEALATTYVSDTVLTAEIGAALVAVDGAYGVAVSNPAPSGGTSGPVTFPVLPLERVARSFSGGSAHTCAVHDDRTLWCVGMNMMSQLGDDTSASRSTLAPVPGLAGVVQVAAGYEFTCARLADGTAKCWGDGSVGQVGIPMGPSLVTTPQAVPGVGDLVDLSAGHVRACSVRADGTVWCWGLDEHGNLGGYADYHRGAFQIAGISEAVQVTARGDFHTCALRRDGTVWCWGEAASLGIPDQWLDQPVPQQVPGLGRIAAITAGGGGTCALRTDGTVWCWGSSFTDYAAGALPSQIQGLGPAVMLAAGNDFMCAVERQGTVRCWGSGGALGDGTTASHSSPVAVHGLDGAPSLDGVTRVAAGWNHSLAQRADRSYVGWGHNTVGPLGDGTMTDQLAPVPSHLDTTEIRPYVQFLFPCCGAELGRDVSVRMTGASFLEGAVISFDGTPLETTRTSSLEVSAVIPGTLITTLGLRTLTVSNPPPTGGSQALTILVWPHPPTLSALTPASAPVGSSDLVVSLSGSGFSDTTPVTWDGDLVTVLSRSPSLITFAVPAARLSTGRYATVSAYSDYPYGKADLTFSVVNPTPVVTSVAPASVTAGGYLDVTITVSGSSFARYARVTLGGTRLVTTFVSSTQLTAVVRASALWIPGTWPVGVWNPEPSAGASNTLDFSAVIGAPVVSVILPSIADVGAPATTLTLYGSSFATGATVTFAGTRLTLRSLTSTQIRADAPASLLAVGGRYPVVVSNPSGASSSATFFTVWNPTPTLGVLTPASATAGGGDFVLSVSGTSFVPGASVLFGGAALPTTVVSSTELRATVPAARVAVSGTYTVMVANPDPARSVPATTFTVNNPSPVIASVSPARAVAQSAGTLTVRGAGFASGASVALADVNLSVTSLSATELQATIPATIAGGSYTLIVTNPAPAAAPGSASVPFTVDQPQPVLASLAPASCALGLQPTLTLAGAGFVAGARVTFGGADLATTFVSSAELRATLPAALVAALGTFAVAVTNPEPGSPVSGALDFQVVNPSPAIAAVAPASTPAAFDQTLTLTGGGFVSTSRATLDGATLATTFVSSTELRAAVPGGAIWRPGVYAIAVVSDAPGGGTSLPFTLTAAATNTPVTIQSNLETCALGSGGSVRCAGSGTYGGLGNGANTNGTSPVAVSGLTGVREVAAAWNRGCALLASGEVDCWGYNGNGGLGNGGTANTNVPVSTGLTSAIELSTSRAGDHTCARLGDTTVRCWGLNSSGQLGDGTTTTRRTPTQVANLVGATQITTGAYHTCAVVAGAVWCWGQNASGQLGDGTTTARLAPVRVPGLAGVVEVAAGGYHTCARLATGTISCWGHNGVGQTGVGYAGTPVLAPSAVGGVTGTTQLTAGIYSTCAAFGDGAARCWGQNNLGQLGDGTTTARYVPTLVVGLANVLEIRGGAADTTCTRTSGGAFCWGNNTNGQIGDGTTTNRLTPVAVPF